MDMFQLILETITDLECNNDNNLIQLSNSGTRRRSLSSSRSRRAFTVSSEQRTFLQDSDDDFFQSEDEDNFSDHSLVILNRQEVLQEYGITIREPITARSPISRGIIAPPSTPAVSRSDMMNDSSTSFPLPSHINFVHDNLPSIEKDLPTFLKNVYSYPFSHIMASCFNEELEVANRKFLDADGDITIPSSHITADYNEVERRMEFLNNSISFLESVVPPGR